ncbi:hypothetical protein QUA62_05595 [Microcoleus sp. MON1_C1]|uniref:hypothetical protein n=1 Tax=Microcoleus sp. MON1_C1 TaxID=2818827 RepID=UPI002FD1892A
MRLKSLAAQLRPELLDRLYCTGWNYQESTVASRYFNFPFKVKGLSWWRQIRLVFQQLFGGGTASLAFINSIKNNI